MTAAEDARGAAITRARRREAIVAAAGPLEADTAVIARAAAVLPVVGTVRGAAPDPSPAFVSRAARRRRRRNRIRLAVLVALVTVATIVLVAYVVVTAAAWT